MINDKQKPGVGIGVMVLKENRVLLGKRHGDPARADSELHGESSWTMPGGKLHFKEELEECAIRELFEETGIKTDKENLKMISVANDIVPDAHFVTIGYLCKEFEGEAKVMEPDEITKWQWFDLDNLPSPIFFPSEEILEKFKKDL